MARSRLRNRLLLVAGSIVVALLAAEVFVRLSKPPSLQPPVIIEENGRATPLADIKPFLARVELRPPSTTTPAPDPHGTLPQGRLRVRYSEPRLDYFDEDGCVEVSINSRGFRDDEFALRKQPGELRILAVGDSFTFGVGVRAADSWPELLQSALRARLQVPVEVINAGVPGLSPATYHDWLRSDGVWLQPDIVVVGVCLNDLAPLPLLTHEVAQQQPVLGGYSQLLDRCVWLWRDRSLRATPAPWIEALVRRAPELPEWQECRDGLLSMQRTAVAHEIPLVVAVMPMFSQLDQYPLAPLHALVQGFCEQHGIPCVDLLAEFEGQEGRQFWVHPTDQHPNDKAHRRIADGIMALLIERRLVD